MEVSRLFMPWIVESCGADPLHGPMDHLRAHLHRRRAERVEREDPRQAHRALERQPVRRLGVHHAPHVASHDREGMGARRGVLRGEDDDGTLRRPVVAGLGQLLGDAADAHGAVLRFDHHAELVAAGAAGVHGQDEVALLAPDLVPRDRARSFQHVAEALRDAAQHALEDVLEIGPLRGSLRPLVSPRPIRLGLRLDLRGEGIEALGDLGVEPVERRALARGVEELGEPAAVAVEVGPQHRVEPPDG